MFCKRLIFTLAFTALAFLTACRRQPARPQVERIAILRFENLGADPSGDWMGRAFSEIITSELTGLRGIFAIPAVRLHAVENGLGTRPVGAPGISAERTAALAAGATRIVVGQYAVRGGLLQARMTVEDEITGRMTVLKPVTVPVAEFVAAASDLARQVSDHAVPYATRSSLVVEAHAKAMEHLAAPGTQEELEKAIATDPDFGPAYRELAQLKIQQKDLAGAEELLSRGAARQTIPAAERAVMRLELANLHNDGNARIEALTALATATPSDPQLWRDLAATTMASHRYANSVDAFRKAVSLEPGDPNLWNQLAYAAAYAGDLSTATNAVDHYQKLQPGSANPIDTLGDIYLIAGNLSQADAAYTQNAGKHPEFFAGLDFLKAAMVQLMTAQVAAADPQAHQYLEARAKAKDPALEIRKAQWAWISGRRKAACQQLEELVRAAAADTGPGRMVAEHAWAQLAMWQLLMGNRQVAYDLARKAAPLPEGAMAQFLSQPPASPAEWQARAKALVPNPAQQAIGNVALADALLIGKHFSAALPLLQSMYDNGNPSVDEGLPVLLAWADVETGHISEAAELLRSNVPLSDAGLTWSTTLYFPRIFYLRAVVAEKQGKPDIARENWRIFHTLSGPDPLMWGEEQKGQ